MRLERPSISRLSPHHTLRNFIYSGPACLQQLNLTSPNMSWQGQIVNSMVFVWTRASHLSTNWASRKLMTGYELQKVAVNARENSDIPASGILTLEQFSCFTALETFSLNIVLCKKNRLPLDFLSRRQSQRKLVLSSSLQRKLCIPALQWFDRQSNIWYPSRTCRAGCIRENRFL